MKFRAVFAAVPVLAFLKLTACSSSPSDDASNTNPTGPGDDASLPPKGDGSAGDSSTDGSAPLLPMGSCTVSKKGTAGLLIKGRLLLPDTIVDGELYLDAKGVIACADASCATAPPQATDPTAYAAGYAAATQVTCTDAIISPGLINPHDHITFANTPPKSHGTERYEHRHDWRKGLEGHTKIVTAGTAPRNTVYAAEVRFLMSGVTSAASAGGEDGLIRNVDSTPAQLGDIKLKIVDSDTFPLADSTPPNPFPPTTGCAAYSASRDKASSIVDYDGFLPHIGEGVNSAATLEFTCQDDNVNDPTHFLFAKQTAVIHGIGANAADIAQFHPTQTALIWSPRSNINLYGNTAAVVEYDNLGAQIALGTDWLPSGSMNMARELHCADDLNQKYFAKHFTDKQLWQMVTQNAAYAVGAKDVLGALKPGYAGDITIFNAKQSKDYRAVIDANVEDTLLVLRGGQPLYGDSALLVQDGIGGAACEDLPVCGYTKKICIKQDIGDTALTDIQTAITSIYPLFFCRGETPKDEPSCTPYRDTTASAPNASVYTSGPSATDKDGDGVPDATDNCPDVFNPIRPTDGATQADADGDGIGDACDKCPLVSGETCTMPSADDLDDDTVPNAIDNCPEVANLDQADTDHDGKGDACDACPADANPGEALCPLDFDIPTLRNPAATGHPASGSVRARLHGVYVTAVVSVQTPRGFYVQSATDPFSGLFIDTDTAVPTVVVGNQVDVEGDYVELYAETTLTAPVITVTDAGTTLPFAPVVVTVAAVTDKGASAEGYEGMLCEIDTVTVSSMNPDAPKANHDEFQITDATAAVMRVDDYVFDALDNTFPVSTPFVKIVGICGYSFAERKIWPRSTADMPQ